MVARKGGHRLAKSEKCTSHLSGRKYDVCGHTSYLDSEWPSARDFCFSATTNIQVGVNIAAYGTSEIFIYAFCVVCTVRIYHFPGFVSSSVSL